jgi:hypothetical protein
MFCESGEMRNFFKFGRRYWMLQNLPLACDFSILTDRENFDGSTCFADKDQKSLKCPDNFGLISWKFLNILGKSEGFWIEEWSRHQFSIYKVAATQRAEMHASAFPFIERTDGSNRWVLIVLAIIRLSTYDFISVMSWWLDKIQCDAVGSSIM